MNIVKQVLKFLISNTLFKIKDTIDKHFEDFFENFEQFLNDSEGNQKPVLNFLNYFE